MTRSTRSSAVTRSHNSLAGPLPLAEAALLDQLGAEHKKASEDATGSKVDDRAVLGHESTRGSDLVEMNEHDRVHVGKHDPSRARRSGSRGLSTSQVMWPGNLPE